MSNADKQIKEILEKYGEDFAANTWLVPGGKARAIKHDCIERMVAKANITFDKPEIVCADPNNVALIVSGQIGAGGTSTVWSFGEASPKNNKNAYPYAMAEKRAKDRVALKLIGLHGLLYSEEEADEFKSSAPRQEPSSVEVDKTSDRTLANALKATLAKAQSVKDLAEWFANNKETVEGLPESLTDEVRAAYAARLHELKTARAA